MTNVRFINAANHKFTINSIDFLYYGCMVKLPDLDHLRAFEAAARYLSFKEAAKELNVTAAAVGQRIRSLESQIGKDLFVRKTRQVYLTSHGQMLIESVSSGLDTIRSGLRQLHREKPSNLLTVSATVSFVEMCLLPHLSEFTGINPECDIRLISTAERSNLDYENIDVAIRYGRGRYSGCECQLFTDDSYILICSPEFLKSTGPLESPSDILTQPLIETNWQIESDAAPTWDDWFQLHNLVASSRSNRFSVSIEAHAVRAAMGGQGIALCHQLYAGAELGKGTLVQLLESTRKLQPAFRHYLIWRRHADTPHAHQFRAWIQRRFEGIER